MSITIRAATREDLVILEPLMHVAIDAHLAKFLDADQVAASHAIMGADPRLIDDGTYFTVECDGAIAGCGGWSRRAALYHATGGADDELLDPATDAARVRAMYTHPHYARRGIGRLVLERCRHAAAAAGFARLELVATLAGEPLYRSFGFEPVAHITDTSTGTPIPLVVMTMDIADHH
jgi:GNAT superfamily N-acetyltransferase